MSERGAMDMAGILRTVRSFLEPRGWPVDLAGAMALNAYGLGRSTADLDLLVPAEAQAGLVDLLEGLGYETLHRSEGYSNHLHADPVRGRVDVIYLEPDTAARLFAGCRTVAFAGFSDVLLPRPEHLIALKVHAIRNNARRLYRDMADIEFLVRHADVDRDEVRGYFEKAGLEDRWRELERAL